MKKHVLGFFAALASVVAMAGCDVGLGEVVDTQSPTLEIVYPPMAATVRDKFILYGTWSDDKGVSSVSVKVVNTETKETVDSLSATVNSDKTWQVSLNESDSETGYYKYKDGSYQISVTAYDGAGHSSGESSRTFDIDNTAPVFVISNPGVVKSDNLEASAYGSVFTIDGTIADDHPISLMDVAIYDQSGSLVSHETYDSEQIDFFREEEISTAGGTSVTIAQYADSPSTTANTRYSDVYGTDSSAGTKYYYASVTLTDSAQIYQNPTGSERSAADVKTDSLGNATSKVYLYDDVYTSLMSAKKGLGLSAADLKNILNGTVSNDSALSALNESVKDTASSEDSRLYFSLNPEANPTYTISGYTFGFGDGETVQSASNGNTVNVTINSGLDGVKVDPSTLKLWMYTCDGSGKPTEADVSEKISNLASKVKLLETNASSDGEETITESQIAEIEETGWTLVYDYYAYNGSTVDVKSIAMTLPSSGIVLNKYYILAATGYDADDVPFSQKTIYGFAGNVSGIAPTIEILTPENGAFVSADSLEFTGTALVNNDSLHVSKLKATISAWNGSIAVGDEDGYAVTLTYDATEAKWTSTNSEAFSINGTAWSFVPSKIDGFLDATADATKYTLSIYGESSSGHNITMSSMVQLDTTAPVVSITTVTPTVSGSDVSDVVKASNGYDESNVYINGTVRIMGSIVEQNLASVTYDIWASTDLTKELTVSDSILAQMKAATENNPNIPAAYDGNLETSNSIDVSFMSSMVTQGMIKDGPITEDTPIKIRVVITATDEVGNTGTYSSDEYNDGKDFIIYQETDRPKIEFGNADDTVSDESGIKDGTNLFGTSGKLTVNLSDDDGVQNYRITLTDSSGNIVSGSGETSSLAKSSTSYTKNYALPETEGVYTVSVSAWDENTTAGTEKADSYGAEDSATFFIAVDSGAPTLSVDSVAAYVSTSDSITGTVSKNNGTEISAVFFDSNFNKLSLPMQTTTPTDELSWSIPLSGLPENASGKYILKITATDKYQQKSSTNVTFSMDPNKPTITEPTSEQTVKLDESSYVTLNVVVNDDDGGSGLFTVGYYLSEDNTAPSTYDSVTSWTAMNKTNEDWRTTLDISSVKNEDGVLYAFFGAKDNAGNTQVSTSSIKLTIDKTAPAITVTGFDGNAVSANGTSKTTSGNSFSVTVADTNVASLSSSNSNVSVGSESEVTGGKTYPVTVSWSSTDGKIEDSQDVTFTATDANGRTAAYTVTLSCDNSAPMVTLNNYDEYASSSVELTGTVSDTNFTKTSSNFKVYLLPADSAKATKSGIVTFGDSDTSWSATFTGLEETSYDIVVVAKDSFGNSSAYRTGSVSVPDDAGFTGEALAFTGSAFNVDVNAPELTENSVTIGTSSENASQTENFYYNGGSDSIYISGPATDLASGIDSVVILPYSKTATDEITATYDSTSGTFTATIAKSKITKSGTIYAKITDKAGNSNEVNLAALTYDATAPKIQSYALSDNTSGFTAYNSGKDSSGNAVYYVNNGYVNNSTGHKFTLSGIATDNLGLASAVLSINDSKIDEITDEDSLSSYSFTEIDLTSLTGDATAKITLTDKAGNTAKQSFTIKLDTAAPQGSHDTDSANQDYIFRIGSGTGGKYSAGTYGNASTIQIRGYFNETGSGTNMIYYKLFSGSAPTAENAETFLTSYESEADGYFSPLSSEESAEVSSSVDSTTKTVKTNFKSNISGFQEGKNYLLLVAVDNVGNADLDKVVYSYTDESGTEVPVAGCYSINVDTTLPSVESDVSSTILTNGNGDITISGTAADSDAGIDSVTVKITAGTATYSSADTDSNITVTTKTASSDTDNDLHWTATISKDAFSSVESGNFTVYATATDKAGEGNSQTVSVANISVDKVAPTVTLTKPTTADSSKTDNTYINGTIGLSGTIKDANTLPDTAITGIQVSTDNSSWKYVSSDSADSESIVMDSFSFEGNYTFTVSGFDTTKLDDETEYYIRAVAVDAAGNTGYSDGVKVKVSQDTDRPVVKITNLSVSSDGSYILKYGTDSQITATVTDDDGIDSVVISGSEYTGSETVSGERVYTASTGTVTFTPADTADGTKTFYVYVKDSEGKEFYTTYQTVNSKTDYLNIPKISVANEDIGNEKEAAVFTYVSDSTSPVVGTVEGLAYKSDGTTKNGGYNSETASYTEYETVGASYVVGGTERQNVVLKISASDKNGIAGMTAELSYKDSDGKDVSKKIRTSSLTDSAYSEYTENGSLVVFADDSTSATWTWTTTDLISLAAAATGSITLTVTPYDKSGLVGNGTFTFVADQSGPTVKVTSPSSTEHVSGSSILVSGIATDVGGSSTSTIQWGIPNASGKIEKWQGELTATSSVSAWSFNFDGSSNASFSEFLDSSKYKVSESDDSIWTIPVYFKASDLLGNETVYDGFSLLYDPDADRPQTTLSYPGEADKKSGENYAILGGTIRATGSVEIPDGSTSVWAVYMQISDDNGEFGTADKTRASNAKAVSDGEVAPTGYGYEVVDADSMEANWQTANSNTGSLNFHSTDSSKDSSYRSSWWGIKVTKNSGSWYVNLNSLGELNSNVSGSTNNIKVRFCGVSAEGKVGHWTEPYSIHIDSNVPKYTTAMYKYSGGITSVSNLYTEGTYTDSDSGIVTASKIKSYEADMYLKGQWYAFAKITDESSVKITGVKRGTTSLTYGTDYFVYPEVAGNDGENSTGSDLRVDSSDSASYVAYVWVKIDPSYTTTQTYTITAKDSDGTPNYIYPAFELNTDNTAPSLTALTDASDTAISMTKLRNSDHGISFKTAATDTGSGFDKLLFYFKRTITNNSTAATTIELPLPAGSSGAWTTGSDAAYVGSLTKTDSDLSSEGNELYGVTLSGTSSSDGSSTTFTADSDISAYKFIRKGGVIKLSGIYYVISDVSGNAITVDSAVSGSPTSAFAAAAMVLDHVSTAENWTWTNGTCNIAGDEDEDGFVETIKKSGSTWTCEATIMGNQLEDGPISLVTVAFDKAENVTTTTTNVMIANNTPRLAKVFLATDLNGDGKYTDNEFGSSKIKNLNQTYKFYSALTNGTEGSASEVVTISQSSDEATVGLTMRDSLAAAFEFVSGDTFEGYGSGNGDLYYKLDVGTEKLDEAQEGSVSATDGKKLTKLDSMSEKFASVSDIEIGSTAVSAKNLTGLVITPENITSKTYGTHDECTSSEQKVSYIGLTLWDSTKGTTPGVGDTVSDKKITAFGSQSTVVNIPIYIDLTDDVDPKPTFADPTAHADGGHVELSGTLPSGTFNGTAEYDSDTKVSGKVVFTGTVSDEKRISSIKLTSGKAINSTLTSAVEVASYDTTNGLLKVTDAASKTDGWTFAINETTADAQFSVTDGHKVTWKLTLDSSYVENVAASNVKFTLTASDGTNGADAECRVDIVPYITGIVRGNTTISGGTMNRSNIGRYPVAEGETLKVSGYNLGTSGSWTVGTNNTTTSYTGTKADDGTYSFSMIVPARSGNLSVNVNSISSLNNDNDNTQENNKESFKMSGTSTSYSASDNRYLSVWNLGNYFNNTSDGAELQQPVMTADKNGNLYASWAAQSNSNIMINKGLGGISSAVFRCYDQPSVYTGFAFDQKGTSGGANITFIPEHQGSGGTFGRNGMSSTHIVGGSGSINLPSDFMTNSTSYSGYKATVEGNPTFNLDSSGNTSSYYSLESYDVNRRLGSFENPQSARFGNYLHNVWYDNVTEGLKYSVVDISDKSKFDYNAGAINGWVVLDGGYTGQDRLHTFTQSNTVSGVTAGKTYKDVEKVYNNVLASFDYMHSAVSLAADIGNTSNRTYRNSAVYSTEIFIRSANITAANDVQTTGFKYTNAAFSGTTLTPAEGDTIALMYNANGDYKIELRKVATYYTSGYIALDSAVDWLTSDNAANITATVYKGDMNVVGGNAVENINNFTAAANQSSSAGSSAAIDVTTDGYPVVAYYDATNSQLRLACASAVNPSLASQWMRVVPGVSCSGEVSLKVDGANNVHIMYNNEDGQMCYLFGKYSAVGSYTWSDEEVVDENGSLSYGSISVVYDGSSYVPAMTYLNKANTANGVKYAYRTVAPAAADASSGGWDFMIIPALGNGHYALKENKISLESSNNWTSTSATVLQNQLDTTQPSTATPATVDSVIAYKTSKAYETAYLKKE